MVDEDLAVGVDIGGIDAPFAWNVFFGAIDEGVEEGEVGGGEGVGEDEVVVGVEEGKGLGALVGGEGRVQFYGFLGVVILRVDNQVEGHTSTHLRCPPSNGPQLLMIPTLEG